MYMLYLLMLKCIISLFNAVFLTRFRVEKLLEVLHRRCAEPLLPASILVNSIAAEKTSKTADTAGGSKYYGICEV